MTVGRVYLLGAGPGDPELITLRAARRLAEADLVLYDALVHPDILALAGPGARKVFVGKRAGRVSERQSAIHQKMIEGARAGLVVARLKGGDPYLFGRGSEEAEALFAAGVPFEVVPGVPSATAATAYAGISLTHRDKASSVAYITATESPEKDRSSHDWPRLATATQSLVIFMGLRKLGSLMELLVAHGRSADTPAAVIEAASTPRQRTVVAEAEADLGMPALTVVGEVVTLRDALRWYDVQPLFGKRVLVTRPEERTGPFARMLRDEGAEPVCEPAIVIAPPADPSALTRAVAQASIYDWIVFTSAAGVDAFFAEVASAGRDARVVGSARLACIGPATADALRLHGLRADVVPAEFRGEAAAEAILAAHANDADMRGARVLLPRAAVARDALPQALRAAGAQVDVVPAYQNQRPDQAAQHRLAARVRGGEVDVVTLTSPSTLQSLCAALGDDAAEVLAERVVAAIGPVTAAAAAERGVRVDVCATHYTAEGLLAALRDHFARSTPSLPR